MKSHKRVPTAYETSLLSALIQASTVARDALKSQLANIEVEGELAPGSDISGLRLAPKDGADASAANGNPVTAVGRDVDGMDLVVQLLVSAGRLSGLAVFRGDGRLIQGMPTAGDLRFHDTHEFYEGQVLHLDGPPKPDSDKARDNLRRPERPRAIQQSGMRFEVYADSTGNYRWRLVASNGQMIATSGEGFTSKSAAVRAAEQVRDGAGSAVLVA